MVKRPQVSPLHSPKGTSDSRFPLSTPPRVSVTLDSPSPLPQGYQWLQISPSRLPQVYQWLPIPLSDLPRVLVTPDSPSPLPQGHQWL